MKLLFLNMRFLIAACACLALISLSIGAPTSSRAMEMRILATVNGTPISDFDLSKRLDTMILLSGLPDTQSTREKLKDQALRNLIEDELKRQEGKELGIEIPEKDIGLAMEEFERRQGLTRGALARLLKDRSIEADIMKRQVEADVIWTVAVGQRYRASTRISDEEIDEEIARIEASAGKTEHLLAEIYLAFDGPESERAVRQAAHRLRHELVNGALFSEMARSFSQSPTAPDGGDLGWVVAGTLEPEIEEVIREMPEGRVSDPIRLQDGYSLILLRDRRVSTGLTSGKAPDPKVTLHQLVYPLAPTAAPAEVARQTERAKAARSKANSCEMFASLVPDTGSNLSGKIGTFDTSKLPPKFRKVAETLPVGAPSNPIRTDNGMVVLMVCDRIEPEAPKISKDKARELVRARMINTRLSRGAIQYLRDIRRQAYIEFKK